MEHVIESKLWSRAAYTSHNLVHGDDRGFTTVSGISNVGGEG